MRYSTCVVALTAGAGLLFLGCAPGLEGAWRFSGDYEQAQYSRFSGELQLDDTGTGHALVDVADHPSVRVPLCEVQRTETTLSFVIDGAYPPGRTCDAISRPLSLRADVGTHVIAGEVRSPEGQVMGLWRALRKLQ